MEGSISCSNYTLPLKSVKVLNCLHLQNCLQIQEAFNRIMTKTRSQTTGQESQCARKYGQSSLTQEQKKSIKKSIKVTKDTNKKANARNVSKKTQKRANPSKRETSIKTVDIVLMLKSTVSMKPEIKILKKAFAQLLSEMKEKFLPEIQLRLSICTFSSGHGIHSFQSLSSQQDCKRVFKHVERVRGIQKEVTNQRWFFGSFDYLRNFVQWERQSEDRLSYTFYLTDYIPSVFIFGDQWRSAVDNPNPFENMDFSPIYGHINEKGVRFKFFKIRSQEDEKLNLLGSLWSEKISDFEDIPVSSPNELKEKLVDCVINDL